MYLFPSLLYYNNIRQPSELVNAGTELHILNFTALSKELKFKQYSASFTQTTTKNLKLTMFASAHVVNVFACHTIVVI
ncbi:hypothetical protein T01_4509 [Trichinella spiralis]|uniref:Uncharacterized protein n=1 Tax=Trichinella spiralis TaxID=6334 RepID=A0A0V1BPV7_TRISP|nr:hypothetical protein T01_4509 [Trichinella spiralis]